MTTLDPFCQEKTYQTGSSDYYAYLFLKPEQKPLILALHAFYHELDQILLIHSDPAIAHIKLAWWHKEIEQLFAGHGEHPISHSLRSGIEQFNLSKDYFYQLIDAIELDLDQSRYLDWPNFQHYAHVHRSSLFCLISQCLGLNTEPAMQFARQLGEAVEYAYVLRNVGQDARQGRIYIPMSILQKHQLRAADILNSRYSETFQVMMQDQANWVRQLFMQAFAQSNPVLNKALRPLLIKSNILLKLLRVLEKDQWQILDQHTDLTPISKLAIASKVWLSNGRKFGLTLAT